MMPVYGTNPHVGFNPTIPHEAAGILMLPAWSQPMDMSTAPFPTRRPEPLLEPPALYPFAQGL
jgi:hypothetical protein